MPPPRSRTHGLHHLALAGVVGPPLFILVFTLAGWLRPGYSALRQEVSALGVGPMVAFGFSTRSLCRHRRASADQSRECEQPRSVEIASAAVSNSLLRCFMRGSFT